MSTSEGECVMFLKIKAERPDEDGLNMCRGGTKNASVEGCRAWKWLAGGLEETKEQIFGWRWKKNDLKMA